jgi:hypothetical protein
MESDSIRASGSNTLIDIWIEGKLRAICVTSAAIDAFLAPEAAAAAASEDARCEFVRGHLPQLITAVKTKLCANPSAEAVIIDSGELGRVEERRKGERRTTKRRKASRPSESLPHGERRQGERRKGERRKPGKGGDG